jgi:signal transduction histidine kinase
MPSDLTTTPNPPFSELGPMFDTFSAEHREVLARLSHELRAPLTSILVCAGLLLNDAKRSGDGQEPSLAPGERVEFLEIVVAEANRLKEGIERLLSSPNVGGQ